MANEPQEPQGSAHSSSGSGFIPVSSFHSQDEDAIKAMEKKIKFGSIINLEGYLKHSNCSEFSTTVVNRFNEQGLAKFIGFDYKEYYKDEVIKFYYNRELSKNCSKIRSFVDGIEVIISAGDIRRAFDIPEIEDGISDMANYVYDKASYWLTIKTENAPDELNREKGTFRKAWLRQEVREVIEILQKTVCPKVSGVDDVALETIDVLHSILNGANIDWGSFIFNQLYKFAANNVKHCVITQTVGFGYMVGYLLKDQGIIPRTRASIHTNCYMFRDGKSMSKKGSQATSEGGHVKGRKKGVSSSTAPVAARRSSRKKPSDEVTSKRRSSPKKPSVSPTEETGRVVPIKPLVLDIPVASTRSVTNMSPVIEEEEDVDEAPLSRLRRQGQSVPTQITPRPPINIDEEIATQMQEDINWPKASESLFVEMLRVRKWADWKMLNTPDMISNMSKMLDEEEFALQWMGMESAREVLAPGAIDRIFEERKSGKGKAPAFEESASEETPDQVRKREERESRRARILSRFEEEFRDHRPNVGTSASVLSTPVIILDASSSESESEDMLPREDSAREDVPPVEDEPEVDMLPREASAREDVPPVEDEPEVGTAAQVAMPPMSENIEVGSVPTHEEIAPTIEVPPSALVENQLVEVGLVDVSIIEEFHEGTQDKEGFIPNSPSADDVENAGTSPQPEAQFPDQGFMAFLNKMLAEQNAKLKAINESIVGFGPNEDALQRIIDARLAEAREAQNAKIIESIQTDGQQTRELIPTAVQTAVMDALKGAKDFIAAAQDVSTWRQSDEQFRADLLQRFVTLETTVKKNWSLTQEIRGNQHHICHNQRILKNDIFGTGQHIHFIGDSISALHERFNDAKKGEDAPIVSISRRPESRPDEPIVVPSEFLISSKDRVEESAGHVRQLREGMPKEKKKRSHHHSQLAPSESPSKKKAKVAEPVLVIDHSGRPLNHIPYPGHGRFRAEHMEPFTSNWTSERKLRFIADKNREIKDVEKEKKRLDDLEQSRKRAYDLAFSIKKGHRQLGPDKMTKLLSDLVIAHEVSLSHQKTAKECVYWWLRGVIDGENLVEAWQHYLEEKYNDNWKSLVVEGDVAKTRANIIEFINKCAEEQRQEEEKKKKEEEEKKHQETEKFWVMVESFLVYQFNLDSFRSKTVKLKVKRRQIKTRKDWSYRKPHNNGYRFWHHQKGGNC